MRYQAALRPELLIYIGKSIHFNHYMRTKCNLNRHINGFLWGGSLGSLRKYEL
jgi:hypothetical protein